MLEKERTRRNYRFEFRSNKRKGKNERSCLRRMDRFKVTYVDRHIKDEGPRQGTWFYSRSLKLNSMLLLDCENRTLRIP